MDDQGDRDEQYASAREHLEHAITGAVAGVRAAPGDAADLRQASWVTETLRQAMITSGELRASLAVRVRQSGGLSFSALGAVMGVTKARAAEIVRKGVAAVITPEPSGRPEPQPVVAAIVTCARGILVTRRRDGTPPYGFVSGEIEPGESPADAAVREVKEETGLLVAAGDVIGRRVHPATGRTMIYMTAVPTHGTDAYVADEAELVAVQWASLTEAERLLPGMFPPVRAYLARTITTPKEN